MCIGLAGFEKVLAVLGYEAILLVVNESASGLRFVRKIDFLGSDVFD